MPVNRLQALLGPANTTESKQGASFGFMPCPMPFLSNFTTPYHLFIQEVYRIARDRIDVPARSNVRLVEFSLN
ncbi:MAG: hypothetical protein ACKO23_01530 [Gemmataceae bacterium]